MFWTEMEKKAQNHVVLWGNDDVLEEIKGKGEERKKEEETVSPPRQKCFVSLYCMTLWYSNI